MQILTITAIGLAFAMTLFEVIPMNGIMSTTITEDGEEHIITVLGSGGTSDLFAEDIGENTAPSIKERNSRSSKTNLIHQGFRIDEETIKQLAEEADKRQLSLSNLVNMILKKHVANNLQDLEEQGFIPVRKDFLRKVFSVVPRDEVEDVGKSLGFSLTEEYVSSFFPRLDSSTLIQFLEIWLGRFQSFQHRTEFVASDNSIRHTFYVSHDINLNFSIALKVMLVGLIEPVIKTIVIFGDPTPTGVVFSFDLEYNNHINRK